jgi:diguanylate cyclase (GGDEF)-like protein
VAAVAILAYILVPADGLPSPVLYYVTATAAVVVMLATILRMPRHSRPIWWAVLGYAALSIIGDLVYTVQERTQAEFTYPGLPDALYLGAYLCAFLALGLLIHRVNTGRDLEAWIDTAIIGIATAAVVALFIIDPTVAAGGGVGAVAVGVAYPLIDVFLLAGLGRLLVRGVGRFNRAIAVLSAAFAITFMADLGYSFIGANSLDEVAPTWLDSLYLIAYVLMAVAARSAGAASIESSSRPLLAEERPGNTRTLLLGLAAVTVPVVIVIAALNGGDSEHKLLAVGCVVVMLLVLWRVRLLLDVIRRQSEQLTSLARSDSLTGLPNRRTLDLSWSGCRAALTGGHSLTIAMMDIDHFKAFNDEFGHPAGDAALVACADAWQAAMAPPSVLARYGGEEFAILLPGLGLALALPVLDRIRQATPGGHTVSIGFAERRPGETGFETMSRADRALYRAKDRGRNRILADGQPEPGHAPSTRATT